MSTLFSFFIGFFAAGGGGKGGEERGRRVSISLIVLSH